MFAMESDDPLARLSAWIDELAAEDLRHVEGAELVRIWKERCRLDAEFTRRFAVFEKRDGFTADGALSGAAWLRAHCHLDAGAAGDRVFTARKLQSLPETEAAFGAGEINYEHARVIARAVESCGSEAVLEHEKVLVDVGREEVPQKLRFATEVLHNAVDPDGALADANAQYARRGFWISELDGMYRLDGNLDREGGAALRIALDAVMGPPAEGDTRTPAQRRADALVELGRRMLDRAEAGTSGGQKPHLAILVKAEALAGAEAGELDWAGPLPGATVLRLACDCAVSLLVVGSDGKVLTGSEERRVLAPAQRRAIEKRDRHCRFPGCDRPTAWTDGHHLVHWADGGPTEVDNVYLFCRPHHRLLHEGGWRVSKHPAGELVALPP
ncbi:MAG TPA: DUF222 domain-containing protein [Candidatus Dormibacteraeota bacterium]